jgi:hypothetical protein
MGWWLYMRLGNRDYGTIDSVSVATYWFAVLVYVLFSWLFYWIVYRLRLKAWIIAQIIAVVIATISTGSLLFVSREHQKQFKEKANLQEQAVLNPEEQQEVTSESEPEEKMQTLDLSEE